MIDLRASPRATALLRGGAWRRVEHYDLCSGSEGYSSASLLSIGEAHVSSADDALITMLLREVIALEGWGPRSLEDLDSEDFVRFVLGEGYIADPTGWSTTEAEFWRSYSEIVAGIRRGPAFRLLHNGAAMGDVELLRRAEIVAVRCFAERWNEYQALLELADGWAYFSWGTSV